jgi:hypothetical protein
MFTPTMANAGLLRSRILLWAGIRTRPDNQSVSFSPALSTDEAVPRSRRTAALAGHRHLFIHC